MTAENLDAILHMIEDHGLSLVMMLIFAGCIMYLVRWLQKRFDAILKAYLNVMENIPSSYNRRAEDNVEVELLIQLDVEIKGVLLETLSIMDSDWAHLWQFHNGVHSLTYKIPFLYITCTHEEHSNKVQSILEHFKQVPTALFSTFFLDAIEHDWAQVGCNDLGVPEYMHEAMGEFKGKCAYMVPIRDDKGKVYAFITCGYLRNHELGDKDRTNLVILARRIGVIMASKAVSMKLFKPEANK